MSELLKQIFDHGSSTLDSDINLSKHFQDTAQITPQNAQNSLLRPALPILLLPLAMTLLAMLVACTAVFNEFYIPIWLLLLPASALGLVLVISLKNPGIKRWQKLCLLSLFCFFIALFAGNLFWQDIAADARLAKSTDFEDKLQIISDASQGSVSKTSTALATLDNGQKLQVRLFWDDNYEPLPKGSWVLADISFIELTQTQNWLFESGICGSIKLSNLQNLGFEATIFGAIDSFRFDNVQMIRAIDTPGSALLSGILLGNREALSGTAVDQDFRTCGLSHLIAVSGSHLAVVAALCSWILMRLSGNRKIELTVLIVVLVFYVLLTGLQPSAIRSAIMAAVAGTSFFAGRRNHAPSALCAAAIVMIIVYPANAYSIGFWLSVSAVLGITIFAKFNQSWLEAAIIGTNHNYQQESVIDKATKSRYRQMLKRLEPISSSLAMTVSATLATLPISIPIFAMFSIISPVANLLEAPIVAVMLVSGILAICLNPLLPWLAQPLLNLVSILGDFAAWLSALLASVPYASIPADIPIEFAVGAALVSAAVLYWLWPKPKRLPARAVPAAILVISLLFVMTTSLSRPAQMVVMDIGQGDAILVREGPNSVLIDTGASESALMRALARNQVIDLDAIVITHLDADHFGALSRLRGSVNIKNIYFANGLLEHQANNKAIIVAKSIVGEANTGELDEGDSIKLGKTLQIQIVWPQKVALEGSNSESICAILSYDAEGDGIVDHQTLLTGDAEENEIAGILDKYSGLQADVYKVGHHGSKGAITLGQLQALGSKFALISVGANNRYGHPTKETLQILEEAGCQINRTDLNGDITVKFENQDLSISCATINQEIY